MRGMKEPKEGVDFKWVVNEGTNVRTRKFFTKAEKEAMKKKKEKKKTTTKKSAAPKTSKRPQTRKSAAAPKVTTEKLSSSKVGRGRGDGMVEMVRRSLDSDSPSNKTKATKKAAPKKAAKDYTYQEWRNMSTAERKAAGLPTSGGRAEFNRVMSGIRQQKFNRFVTDVSGKKSEGKRGDRRRRRGMAKGGMVKANCGASTKPNRMARK